MNKKILLYNVMVVSVVVLSVAAFVWWNNDLTGDEVVVGLDPTPEVHLEARYYASSGAVGKRGVVLLHQYNSNQDAWNRLAAELQERNFEVITFDFRPIHNESIDDKALVQDAAEAVQYLREVRPDMSIAVVGAGLGANVGMKLAEQDEQLAAVVLISPQYNYHGVKITRANQRLDRPVYYLVSQSDTVSLTATQGLYDQSRSPNKTLRIATTAEGRGTKLLRHAPKLRTAVMDWLDTTL